MTTARAFFEPIKTLAFGGISGTYAPVGSPTSFPIRAFKVSNNTQGHLYLTTNTSRDEMFVAAGSFTLYDIQSNINPKFDDQFVIAAQTQFYVKQITAPTSGAVYIECIF